MGTVGGVKAQRIHTYILHKAVFPTKTLVCTENLEFNSKFNHKNWYFWIDFGPSTLQIKL